MEEMGVGFCVSVGVPVPERSRRAGNDPAGTSLASGDPRLHGDDTAPGETKKAALFGGGKRVRVNGE